MPFKLSQLQYLYYALMVIVALAGLVGTIFGRSWLKRQGKKAVKNFTHFVYFPVLFAAWTEESKRRFDAIEGQLTRNGGSSMRDSIDRIENSTVFFGNKLRFQDDCSPKPLFEMQIERGGRFSCSYVNPAMCKMLGYAPDELLGANWLSKIAETERESVLELWNFAIKTSSPFESRQHIEHGERNEMLHIRVFAQPQTDRQGDVCHYFGHIEFARANNFDLKPRRES